MDFQAVVTVLVEDGRRLLVRLAERGFDISAAGWVQTEYDSKPYLYITSPQVDRDGIRACYTDINAALADTQPSRVDPFEVKLLPTTDPLAAAMRHFLDRYGHRTTEGMFIVSNLQGVSVRGTAWIYPPVPSAVPAGS